MVGAALIGQISGAYLDGRRDRKAGLDPATAKERHETGKLHVFYLMGYRQGWKAGEGFPQLEIPGLASQDARAPRLDSSHD
jgi:hypothetical protein